jgi:alanine racemase
MELQGDNFGPQPGLSWKMLGSGLHAVGRDESVGYGRTWTKRRPSELVVIPGGYADGYSVSLGNRGEALFRGRPASVVGRVCIDILTADVIYIPEVTSAEGVVQVEELASLNDSINFEFLTRPLPAAMSAIV